jgi:hypothetical protein
VFCDEQYDCVKPVLCAVASTLNKRVTTATNMVDKVGVNVDMMTRMCRVVPVEDSRAAGECSFK